MSESLLNRIIELIIKNNYSNFISCGTGETLTYPRLYKFIYSLLSNSDAKLRILSNGKLLSGNLPSIYFDNRIVWGITFDGFENSDLKNLQKGIDIEIVKQNIHKNCEKGRNKNFYLNYTLNSKNFDSLKKYIDFAASCGIEELYCTQLKIFKGFEHLLDYKLSEKQINELQYLEDYAKALKIKKVHFEIFPHSFDKCYLRDCAVSPIIDADGKVAFCYGQEDKFIGNIADDDVFEKWNDLIETLKSHENSWCDKCYSKINKDGIYEISSEIYPFL